MASLVSRTPVFKRYRQHAILTKLDHPLIRIFPSCLGRSILAGTVRIIPCVVPSCIGSLAIIDLTRWRRIYITSIKRVPGIEPIDTVDIVLNGMWIAPGIQCTVETPYMNIAGSEVRHPLSEVRDARPETIGHYKSCRDSSAIVNTLRQPSHNMLSAAAHSCKINSVHINSAGIMCQYIINHSTRINWIPPM